MVDAPKRRIENVFGEYFVDDQCISCGACWAIAPEFFFSHEIHTYAYVYRQPTSASEIAKCQEALRICPIGAIGQCI